MNEANEPAPDDLRGNPPSHRRARPRGRVVLFRLLGVSFGCLAAFALAEITLRIAWGSPRLPAPAGSLTNDPELGLFHVAGFEGTLHTSEARVSVRYDEHGLRDGGRPKAKPPGTWRVIALGDSYVEGHGVEFERMFASVLERRLAPPPGFERVEVVKAGVGGWGPVEEARWLEARGLDFHPDLVLLFFYVGNDFRDALAPDDHVVVQGVRLERAIAERMTLARRLRIELRKRVLLYGWAVDALAAARLSPELRDSEDRGIAAMCRADEAGPRVGERPLEDALAAIRGPVARMRDRCRERGAEFRVVVLPHRLQVERERQERIARAGGIDRLDPDLPTRELGRLLDELGIEWFDAAPALRSHAATERDGIGLGSDSHYDAAAHAVVGEAVAVRVREWTAERARGVTP